ncbi:Nitrilase family, member 2 [Seminavis robusta]|uniref:Nitrilase family, member 2 n=1 Tax=Seminavis robusta TaxID=568900 RepID=A0A9N8EFZ4_9STRA|nr:Nitrilase family, member 2 [Seminavis robusta]|eukprot:Sro888_g216470.1 Nitrilase family, member 2 (266) ;mRNA; r:27437-28234
MSSSAPINGPSSSSLLSEDYQPCAHTVIIGRGRQVKNHPGNRRLRDLVQRNAGRYTAASSTRELKTDIIVSVVSTIRAKSKIGFVKFDKANGRWLQLEEAMARSAVGQAFRDLLQGYRSSKQSKQAKRLLEKQASQGMLPLQTAHLQLPFSVPPPPSLNLPRVVSIDGTVQAQMQVPPQCHSNYYDPTCFERLCTLVAMDDQQGNPFEPRPIVEAVAVAQDQHLAAAARTARARDYVAMLRQTSVPAPAYIHPEMDCSSGSIAAV